MLLPEAKLKFVDVGGCGVKVVPWALVPKAGKEAFAKLALGAAGWAGGKLLVALEPKVALAPPKPLNELAALSPGAGEPKSVAWGALPKLTLCDMAYIHA